MRPHRAVPVVILLATATATAAAGQELISLDKVRENVNRYVRVEGTVKDVRRERGGVVWLSLEERYPRGPLVIVLTADMVGTYADYNSLRDQRIRVSGTIRGGETGGRGFRSGGLAPQRNINQHPQKPFISLEDISRLEVLGPPPG